MISVIIPFYDGNRYICKLIEKIQLALCFSELDGEIIVVNDSPWVSVEINEANNIKILTNNCNRGVHYSRVRGIKAANGKFIHMIDQDDMVSLEFYKQMYNCIKLNDMVVSNGLIEYSNSNKILYENCFEKFSILFPTSYFWFGNRITSPGQCLIRKDAIPGEWYEKLQLINGSDDFLLWIYMFSHKCTFKFCDKVLYIHKYTDENLSLDNTNMINSLKEMSNILRRNECKKIYIRLIDEYIDFCNGVKKVNFYNILFRIINVFRSIKN